MSHQDQDGRKIGCQVQFLQQALRWLLRKNALAEIGFREDCTWTPLQFVAAALLWAWSDEATLIDRFHTARKIVEHLNAPQHELAGSYQAFLKMLVRWTARLVVLLQIALRERMQQTLPGRWRQHGFVLFGVDGSRIELPRTKSNELAYAQKKKKLKRKTKRRSKQSAAARARKAHTPQMWLTTVWHAGTGLPWDWRIGPADSSEREHWREMLSQLPLEALMAVDAGFVGYDYVKDVLDGGRHLLLRVGSNVRLLNKLGRTRERDGIVYLWPNRAAEQGLPPLKLRLVIAHNGKHPMYLVTSVLAVERLSDKDVIQLYRQRWGIELFYRHFKQTFQRRKLRSENAANARVELEWSLLGLWAMALYAEVQLARDDIPAAKMSIAGVLRAFRRTMRDYLHPVERHNLCAQLRRAIIDSYHRQNKASRSYPRKKQETPPGAPRIIPASLAQRQLAQSLPQREQKRLTA